MLSPRIRCTATGLGRRRAAGLRRQGLGGGGRRGRRGHARVHAGKGDARTGGAVYARRPDQPAAGPVRRGPGATWPSGVHRNANRRLQQSERDLADEDRQEGRDRSDRAEQKGHRPVPEVEAVGPKSDGSEDTERLPTATDHGGRGHHRDRDRDVVGRIDQGGHDQADQAGKCDNGMPAGPEQRDDAPTRIASARSPSEKYSSRPVATTERPMPARFHDRDRRTRPEQGSGRPARAGRTAPRSPATRCAPGDRC